jgi:hypothetical protein
MDKMIFLLFLLILPAKNYCQPVVFSDDWLGIYQGELYLLHAENKQTDTVQMVFEFLRTGQASCWDYRMIYDSPKFGRQVKDYQLIKPDSLPEAMFLLDEKDGIYIQMVYMGDAFYSHFSVAGQRIISILRKEHGFLLYEIIVSNENQGMRSQNNKDESKGLFVVTSYTPFVVQRAILLKKG